MKFTKSIFGKDSNDIDKFNELDLDERSIVFYAENTASFVTFDQIIYELTEKMGHQICYLTSAKDDPILKNKNKNIRAFYIGDSEITKLKFFLELKARILVMTMPDLGTYHIKRSKSFHVHYVHIFHAMNSTHRNYRKGAFDHFDSIFCTGSHHVEEIEATEQLYNLKQKNLVECGYGVLDKLQKTKPLQKTFVDEKSIFKFLNIQFLEPQDRNAVNFKLLKKRKNRTRKVKKEDVVKKAVSVYIQNPDILHNYHEDVLNEMVRLANKFYYNNNQPIMKDYQYDHLIDFIISYT